MLQCVSDSVTIDQIPFLYLHEMRPWKAWFVAGMETICHLTERSGGGRTSLKQNINRSVWFGEKWHLTVLQSSLTSWCRSLAILHKSSTARPRHSSWALRGGDAPALLAIKSLRSCETWTIAQRTLSWKSTDFSGIQMTYGQSGIPAPSCGEVSSLLLHTQQTQLLLFTRIAATTVFLIDILRVSDCKY